jgi:hypothetical protein
MPLGPSFAAEKKRKHLHTHIHTTIHNFTTLAFFFSFFLFSGAWFRVRCIGFEATRAGCMEDRQKKGRRKKDEGV